MLLPIYVSWLMRVRRRRWGRGRLGRLGKVSKRRNGAVGLTLTTFLLNRVGIGPAYSTKMDRSGIRIADMLDEELFHKKLIRLTVDFQRRFPNLDYHLSGEAAKFQEYREKLRPFLDEQGPLLRDAKAEGKNIPIEGANGFMLDIGGC